MAKSKKEYCPICIRMEKSAYDRLAHFCEDAVLPEEYIFIVNLLDEKLSDCK